jgi:CRISPR-associated protein Cas1
MYAHSTGMTFSSKRLLLQARLASSDTDRLQVARRLYQKRFHDDISGMSIEQIRGMEGMRVRESYKKHSILTGIPWERREYDQASWFAADLPNRALSVANACLYGVVFAGMVSAGYSPGIGFIHTGKMLSFVYDIADIYKTDLSIPLAFKVALEGEYQLERKVRTACTHSFHEFKLMEKILPDIAEVLGAGDDYRENPQELEGKAFTLDG